MTIKTKDGVIVQADDGNPAEDCNCCGEPTTCPTDCSGCASTITVTISGHPSCNGTFVLSNSGGSCNWGLNNACPDYDVNIQCHPTDGWIVRLVYDPSEGPGGLVGQWKSGSFSSCPPTGSYTLQTGSGTCTVS